MFRPISCIVITASLTSIGLPAATAAKASPATVSSGVSYTDACSPIQQLRQPPFAPTDLGLLNTQSYPEGPPMIPAPPRVITVSDLEDQLRRTLKARHGAALREGLAFFTDPQVIAVVPDPQLRAGLASLAGTAAQSSLDAIRSGVFQAVVFGTPGPAAIAEVFQPASGGPVMVFNQRYRFEDFRLLGVVLAHEVLHEDHPNGPNEELINTTLQTALYGQLLLDFPDLATSRTELARRLNTALAALLNTRDARGFQRVVVSSGNVLPGAAIPLPSFAAAFLGPDGIDPVSTPGNPRLTSFLSAIVKGNPHNPAFDTGTVNILDSLQNWASPKERIRLAQLLRLDIACPRPAK